MVRSPGFGSRKNDSHTPYSDLLSLRLRIPSLTLPLLLSRRPILQQVRGQHSRCLPLFVSIGFHVLFHSPPGVLFTFPSRYYFTIGHLGVFSLTRWSSLIHTGFPVSHATRDKQDVMDVCKEHKLQDFHLLWYRIQLFHSSLLVSYSVFPRPQCQRHWFRLFPFRSPLLWESRLLSFPTATKMFQFTALSLSSL
jgi:hypothetical protein